MRIPAHVATVKWRPHSCSLACAGITGFLLLARPAGVRGAAGGSIVRSATAAPAGQHMELRLAAQQLQPGTNYQLAVHYAHARAGVPNPLLSTPVIKTVRTPDPTNPVVVSVAALDPAAVPACRERGAAYDAAGCNDVTILVDPPKSTAVRAGARAYGWGAGARGGSAANGARTLPPWDVPPHVACWPTNSRLPGRCTPLPSLAAITSYTVVCKRCNSVPRRSSQRRLLGLLNPCTNPPTVRGQGEAAPGGKVGARAAPAHTRHLSARTRPCQ